MGQVTLYLDRETEERMKAAARAAGTSQSRWVADLIRQKTALEWPPSVAKLAGAWADDEFPSLDEIRAGEPDDPGREPL